MSHFFEAHHIPLTRRTCGLWRFADMRRRGQNAEIAILAIRIGFAFIRSKGLCSQRGLPPMRRDSLRLTCSREGV
jgi:hypothetical protein